MGICEQFLLCSKEATETHANRSGTVEMAPSLRIAVAGEEIPSLKQLALLFDKVAIPHLDDLLELSLHQNHLAYLRADLEFLMRNDIVYCPGTVWESRQKQLDQIPEDDFTQNDRFLEFALGAAVEGYRRGISVSEVTVEQNSIRQAWHPLPLKDRSVGLESSISYFQLSARIVANKLQRLDGLSATPIFDRAPFIPKSVLDLFQEFSLPIPSDTDSRDRIVQVILNKLAMPKDAVPWESILEFRNNPEVRGYLSGLRTWMADVIRQQHSTIEAEEKLEWLLFQQAKHLQAHKIEYGVKAFGAVFVASMEMVENLAKLRWGKAAKSLVEIFDGRATLSRMELDSPAREVNFILKARNAFGEE
jgi:hypothetical protein